jgi:multidrug efflux pump subunit AcrA (membrane-fusion protein)
MAPSADPASRTVRIKAGLAATPGLMPGRFARLLVPVADRTTLEVPAEALVQRGQLEIVFVVTNRQAQMHLVKSGKRSGDHVTILSGLNSGEPVVVDGATVLADGQPVEVK